MNDHKGVGKKEQATDHKPGWVRLPMHMAKNPAADPFQKQLKEAYRRSAQYQVDQLYKERSKWSRRQTIAANKLAEIDQDIRVIMNQWAAEQDGRATNVEGGAK